ncbi:Pex24p-domain-containing protein [Trichocladium antarcticum]|uniref:Pex24p-domain-containing protein n=1 Tax=Trichocladium antarcticum TaxID=1450529 RepID=A0AAN6UJ77_9PEZI|nr:Pex24p-domain-containing protein [Trichocladium antarcticum]
MSTPRTQRSNPPESSSSQRPSTSSRESYSHDNAVPSMLSGAPPPIYAAFSPATLSATAPAGVSAAKRRSTILVHQKSPLLLATPPQVTRALAYSHPYILLLNHLLGLLTWTTDDPWESFLLLCAFWATVLYGDVLVRYTGPVIVVLALIGGMYGRRFSPLSSSRLGEPGLGGSDRTPAVADANAAKAGRKNGRAKNLSIDGLPDKTGKGGNGGAGGASGHTRSQGSVSEITNTRHQKTLDEIVETLKQFTARCSILLEPLLELTDFLSTQRTATSATTRPALTTLLVRILLFTPFWLFLTLSPFHLITTRRVVNLIGTTILTWHCHHLQVTRLILWRSSTIRKVLALVTGLHFEGPAEPSSVPTAQAAESAASSTSSAKGKEKATSATTLKTPRESELTKALRRARGSNGTCVRFTFIIYENQRRWVGLGWTTNLFSYERPAWADEHNNSVPPRDKFELPEAEDGSKMHWKWVEGSRWRVDGVPDDAVSSGEGEGGDQEKEWDYDGPGGKMGWVYYDTKWDNGRRGLDGWGRWTRRRKWYRDAELIESDEATEQTLSKVNPPEQEQPSSTSSIPTVGLTPSTPDVALTPSTSQHATPAAEKEREDEQDTASMLSTSSRSARFRPPSMRRRLTAESMLRGSGCSGSRRASVAASSEDDAAVLGSVARRAVQEQGVDAGSWGVGDDVRMGLE